MADHPAAPGHTRCAWADAARFTEGPEWPRDADGTLKWLRAPDFRIGHQGPFAVVELYGRRIQDACRVCGWVCSVDYRGDPVGKSPGGPICSSACVAAFMGHLLDVSGPTTEEIVTGRV